MIRLRPTCLALLGSLVLASHTLATAQTASSPFEWRGTVLQGNAIEIKGVNGDITAEPAAGAEAEVTAIRTGRRSDPMDFEFPTKLAAFSPSGARVASILQPDQERLDIWTTADGKPALAFRPYTEEADKNHKKIQAVAFVDDEHRRRWFALGGKERRRPEPAGHRREYTSRSRRGLHRRRVVRIGICDCVV